jgi:outer membrane receptor protein involved in Fe transport
MNAYLPTVEFSHWGESKHELAGRRARPQFPGWTCRGSTAFYKKIRNILDEGQFGQALILSPFNYGQGYARGLELSAIYSEKNWGGYLNVATQKAQGNTSRRLV